ncbi:MAG: hypothetical protein EHM12_00395 [Dehalococcoidia bacterium]|nr:MAG: hypothetical protein EHM12_00395 [Dehalococcoidia bacterium]
MKHSFTRPFLRNLVDSYYAFFWPIYGGRPIVTAKARRKFATPAVDRKMEDMDHRPPFLVCRGSSKRYYAPLRKNPAMHRIFCDITDNKGIIEFASKYGMLGFTRSFRVRKRGTDQSTLMLTESMARWKYELAEMKRLVYLWELVKSKRLSLLGAHLDREDDGIYVALGKRKELIADNSSALARKWDREGEQPVEAALQYLTASINKKVTGSVFPTVLPSYQKQIYLLPGNLLAAMWLMFLWEVIGEVRPRRCPGCNEWFDPKRSTRITCGDRCRKRKSRQNTNS